MVVRAVIIATLLVINFAESPSFLEAFGFTILGFVIVMLTIIPLVGWIVVLGCGFLTYNYFQNIHDFNIVLSIIIGIIVSGAMGALLSDKR